jgi:hypothetical protein
MKRKYGFVIMTSSAAFGVLCLFLMVANNEIGLEVIGQNHHGIKRILVSLLVLLGLTIFYVFSSYALLSFIQTPDLDDRSYVTDRFARDWQGGTTKEIGDIPKQIWSRKLVLEKNL